MLYSLPANWQSFNEKTLEGLLATIKATADGVDIDALAVEATDDTEAVASGVDQLEALADAKDAVTEFITAAAAEAAADSERKADLAARFAADPEPEEAPEEEIVEVEDEELAVEDDAPVVEEVVADEVAPVEEAAAEVTELAVEDAPAVEATPAPAAAPASAADTARRMSDSRTTAEIPAASTNQFGVAPMMGLGSYESNDEMSIDDVASALSDRANTLSAHRGERQFDRVVRSNLEFGDNVMGKAPEDNIVVLQNVEREYKDRQSELLNDTEALVASGGLCAPLMPSYSFFQDFMPQNPLERFLPTVGANRGGIRYIDSPGLTAEALAATGIHDKAASDLVPPAYVEKNCSRVTCPTETQVTVAAIHWCVTFDNLNFRVFPEQVRDFLEQVQVAHTRAKEIYYLDRIDTLANAAVDINAVAPPAYGAARGLYEEMTTIAHNFRKANNMNRDAVIDMLMPDVVQDILAVDMTNDASVGMSVLAGPQGNMLTTLAQKARVNLGLYYYDASVGGFPSSEHSTSMATYNPMPNVVRSYAYSPGSVVRLDGGTLDLGLVRDSGLNHTNDVELFVEQWVEIANPGRPIVTHDHTLCPSGAAPTGAPIKVC